MVPCFRGFCWLIDPSSGRFVVLLVASGKDLRLLSDQKAKLPKPAVGSLLPPRLSSFFRNVDYLRRDRWQRANYNIRLESSSLFMFLFGSGRSAMVIGVGGLFGEILDEKVSELARGKSGG